MADSTAKLREEIMALSGVDIMLDSTTFKSTYQIMEELATKWQDLTDIQQASITELIAGKRQGNIVSSLMTNFDIAQSALQTSFDSSGSAMEEHGKYMDSIEAKLSQLKATWQGFAQTFMNSDFLKGGIDALKVIIDLLEKLIDNFGLLGTVGLGAGITGIIQYFKFLKNDGVETVKTISDVINAIDNLTNTVSSAGNAAKAMGNVVGSAGDVAEAIGDTAEAVGDTVEVVGDGAKAVGNTVETAGDIVGAVGNSAEAIGDIVEAAGDGAEAMTDLGGAAAKTGGSFKAFMKTPMGVAAAIGVAVAAIGLLYNAYKNAKEAASEASQKAIETSDTFLDSASSFEQAYIKYSGRTDLTSEEEAELESAIQGTVDALGDKSSALQSVVDGSNDYLASLEAIKDAELEAASDAANKKKQESEKLLKEAAIGWESFDGSEVNIDLGSNQNSEAVKIANEMDSAFVSIEKVKGYLEKTKFTLSADADTDEIIEYYNFLLDYQKKLVDAELVDTAQYDQVTSAINKMSEAIDVYIDGVYDAAKAQYQLDNGIPKTLEEYLEMRKTILNNDDIANKSFDTRKTIANTLDSEYSKIFDLSSVEAQARKFVGLIKGFGDGTKDGTNEIGTVETFLNMRTAVNNNECTVGEYLSELDNVTSMSEKFSDEEQKEFNTSFGLDTDKIKQQYDDVYNYIKRNHINNLDTSQLDTSGLTVFQAEEYRKSYKDSITNALKEFINEMSSSELSATISLIDENNVDFDNILQNYKDVLGEAEQAGVNFSKTVYGNIDTNARKTLEWTSENLNKYKDELMSWEDKGANWDDVKKSYEDSISAVMGAWDTFKIDGKDVDIAFSPMLQTDKGAELLSSDTVGNYIDKLINEVTKDGKWSEEELLKLDAKGVEIDGQKIKGILADVGETAKATAEQMHFVGKDGALALAESEISTLIEERAKLNDALNFQANIEVDTTALETLNEILTESASAMGLSTEAIESLNSKYSDLEGYDASTLFERTANGVKVNRQELEKLEDAYNDSTKTKVQEHLDTLTNKYNEVTAEIDKCTNAGERAQLLVEREGYADKIEELATYQAQLEGVTGAYQEWINAQNTPEDYEGYEAVATGREDIQSEIDRGFIGNSTRKYIDLLSGEDLDGKPVDDYADAWEKLDDKITGAGYSINDFFTVNDDGDITSTGIDRFFKSLQTDFKDSVAKFDNETKKWTYDFGAENLEKIQEKWGIGIEAIELLLEAAASAGYDIDWDGILDGINLDTSNFETLVSAAEAAQTAFNKLDGIEDVSFNFKTSGVKEATSELEKARSTYIDLITNDDGSINLEANGAAEMRVMLSTLLIQKQQLEDTNIAINIDTSGLDESQQDIANAINAVRTFREKYKNLEIAVTTGQGIEEAKTELQGAMTELQGLGDAGVDIAAELILGEGATAESLKSKVDAAVNAVGTKDIKVGCKLDETALGTLNSQILANFTPEATVKITGIDDTLVGEYTATEKTANGKVKWNNDTSLVVEFQSKTQKAKGIVDWANNVEKVKTKFSAAGTVKWTSGNNVKVKVVSEAKGTANADGSAQSGRAFARGNWGIKGNGVALGGELGQELVVRDGHFFTIGDAGAEFFRYKKNDIIFNAAQTESLFKYGGIKGAKPRGKMLAGGTAFSDGSTQSNGRAFAFSAKATESNWVQNRVTGGHYGSKDSSSEKSKDFEETIDWIEAAIDRIERSIDQLDTKTNSVYRSWSERNKSLVSEIGKVREEIKLQQQAYEKYMAAANAVGLSSSWANKVKNGAIDIDTITDEVLKEKIDDFKKYYEAALDCKDAILELQEAESELYQQRFDNIITRYEGMLSVIEHEKNMLEEYINQSEAQGWLISENYYKALIDNEQENIAMLKKQKSELLAELGNTERGTEQWYENVAAIDEVTLAIEEANTAILEYKQSIQQLNWEVFDLIQDKISAVTEEADFLIELMSSDKLFDDKGKLTDEGSATMGLHGVNYNTYMHLADDAAKEAERIKKELAKDPYDTELEERYREMVALQQEYILNAEQQKDAIKDLVSEGIEVQLDSLQELIDKKNELLESERDLYEYQKKVKEQTKEIAVLEKMLSAYSGDSSEEAQQKIQQIKVDLEAARQDLEETETDRLIDSTAALLDELYLEAETLLNERLDNLDALIENVIAEINADASSINATLTEAADSVGYTLSDSMQTIWDSSTTSINGVITTYGDKFSTAQTTTNTALQAIKTSVQNMVTQLNNIARANATSASTSSAAKSTQTSSSQTSTTKPATTTNKNTSSGGDGTPKIGEKVKFVSGKYYYDSYGTKPLGSKYQGKEVYITNINKKGTHPYHISTGSKIGSGDLGWLKLNQLSGYAIGKKDFLSDEVAWTQEKGREFIVRPSDGAILTPIAKGDSVLTSTASNNIWDMANSPAEFIKDNLNFGANVPNNSSVQNHCVQNFENIVFSMPNVRNYEELLSSLQKDPKFDKLIKAMTIDQIAGKSSLAKGKAIR